MLRSAMLVAAKDLKIEMRSRVLLVQVVPFAGVVFFLFAFALNQHQSLLNEASGGLFWLAVLFVAVLSVQRSVSVDSEDLAGESLLMTGIDPAGVFLGKVAALTIELLVLETVMLLAESLFYQAAIRSVASIALTALVATLGIACAGILYGALSAGSKVRETLLPMLMLPVVSPVLLGAASVWPGAGHLAGGSRWMLLLSGFAVLYLAVGSAGYGVLAEAR